MLPAGQICYLWKSPQTGGIGEARCESACCGFKEDRYDGIIIKGECEKPSILVIDNGKLSIEPADDLWGKNVSECEEILQSKYKGADTAIIGVAGE